MLQMQAHNSSGVIHLCHTSCVCDVLVVPIDMPYSLYCSRSWMAEPFRLTSQLVRIQIHLQVASLISWYIVKAWLDANPNEGQYSSRWKAELRHFLRYLFQYFHCSLSTLILFHRVVTTLSSKRSGLTRCLTRRPPLRYLKVLGRPLAA